MATMNPYTAYDDAGSTPGSMISEIAAAPFKPSTHLWMYGHVPGLWSGTKGVYVPWSKEGMIRGAREIGKSFTDKKYLAGVGQALKMPLNLRPFGGGGRILNFGEKIKKLDDMNSRIRSKLATNWNEYTGMLLQEDEFMTKQLGVIGEAKSHSSMTMKGTKRKKQIFSSRRKKFDDLADNASAKIKQFSARKSTLEAMETQGSRLLKTSAAKRSGLVAGKWALRGAKVVAGIGAATFAWDVAKMIGQPLGRAIVSEFEQVATSFQQRFMPELGGRLEMSYLSRGAATERQRAIDAMSRAQITGRSSFGQESKYVHQ